MLPSENKAQIAGYAGEFGRSFMCFAVQCSVAEVDGCGRVQDCNGAREQAGGGSRRGAHAKVKLSLLILDSTRATRIKCSDLDNGTA